MKHSATHMSNDDWDYDGRRHRSGSAGREDAREKYQENLNKLKNINLEEGEDGQSYFLSMPISKEMKPVAEMALEMGKPFLVDLSDKVFKHGSGLAKKLGFVKSHVAIGVAAENIFRWGVVGLEEVMATVSASNKYARNRRDLFDKLNPVMQATGSNLNNNEVIKVAYDNLHTDWASDMKKVAAGLPALIPTGVYAWQDMNASNKKRLEDMKYNVDPALTGADRVKAQVERYQEEIRQRTAMNKEIEKARTEFHNNMKGTGQTVEEINYEFDRTVAQPMREDFGRKHGRRHSHDEYDEEGHLDTKKENADGWLKALVLPASLLSKTIKNNIDQDAALRRKRAKGWEMIEHLKTELDSHCADKRGRTSEYEDCEKSFTSRTAEEITLTCKGGNRDGETVNLKEYIIELFQQHERDRDKNRNFYDAKTGKAIDPLKGTMLNNLTPLVGMVSEYIADGRLSGDALYKLVGENKVIKHSANGARIFAKEAELQNYIDNELTPVLGTREVIKREEILAKFQDPKAVEAQFKANLQAKGPVRDVFASYFPDDILVQEGLKKQDVVHIRRSSHDDSLFLTASIVQHFAKKTPEEMKALGVTEKEAAMMNTLADKVKQGDFKALKLAVRGRDKELVDAVRTSVLLAQVKGDKSFLDERWKEVPALREIVKKNAEKFSADAAEAKAEKGRDED
ncbi:MAG: hypothetical protein K2Q01_06860, partial [Rickettsiales bacterium]|nr:hypothetical protein [Rickettsiales bacterium]